MTNSLNRDKAITTTQSIDDIQNKLEALRKSRDDLNKKTKEYISSLQDIDNQINDFLRTARDIYKKKRDYWNEKVKQLKVKKNEYKDLFDRLIEDRKKLLDSKTEGKSAKRGISLKDIDRKIEGLERTIETENLEIEKENEIVDKIKELWDSKNGLLKEQQSDEYYKIERKIELVKINMNKIYEQLEKWSNKSQENHLKMLDLYQKVNELRDQKKKIEEELIENKKAADSFHEQFLEVVNQKKKLGKVKKAPRQRRQKGKTSYKSNMPNKSDPALEKLKQEKLASALEKQKTGQKLNLFEARLVLESKE